MNKTLKVSADEIVEVLLSEANETAVKIIKDTEKTAQNILEEQRKKGRERAKDIVTSVAKKAQNDFNIIKLRETASAENDAKWLILEKKHALIENVLNQVKSELRTLIKTNQYIHVLESLIVEGGIIMGETDLEVVLNERDSTLPLDLDKLAEMISIKTGKMTKITKSQENIDVMGGAIIQTPGKDKLKEFYEDNPSLRLIPETSTLVKFRNIMKNFVEKQLLPNIEDLFKLKSLEDMLNNFKRIHSLEDRISEFYIESTPANFLGNGKIVMNNTFEALLKYSESEIRFKIAKILFI
jgi:vacuolar-type H+-ATPase subunit E/Vma4